jgi:ankyrin repeat protein/Mg2+ and Co2+ transporter CorA
MSRSRSRSSVGSDQADRLEPRLLRAAENNDVETLRKILHSARAKGQFHPAFLSIGLLRAAERACVDATQYLLQEGAKVEVTGNRTSPLFRAVERNHVQIVKLLLDHGASPEIRDKKGRTALMTAAWKNHFHVLHLLISRGADVNARDLKKRSILHNLAADKQCDWGDDVVNVLLETQCEADGQDELGRTPLHWACATGKTHFAELLLNSTQASSRRYIDAVELRNKTALHVATAHDREDVIDLLLQHKADVNAKSDGGWTPLHNACEKGCEKIVRMLLTAGADINGQLLNGMTPLHRASQAGHTDVVKCLLERPDLRRRTRDTFGSTPFLQAAQFKRKDIVQLLAPFNHIEALSEDAIGACQAFEATIVDFGNFHNENRVKRVSVYDLLYGRDPKNPHKQAVTTRPENVKATDFRWIHLPANNMAWVEALMTKSFIEEGASDVEGFKGLEKSFHHQHRGQRVHSQFMRPLCQSTPRAPRNKEEEEEDEAAAAEDKVEDTVPRLVINGPATMKPIEPPVTPIKRQKTNLSRTESRSQDEDSVSGKRPKNHSKRQKSSQDTPKSDNKNKQGHGSGADKRRIPSSPLLKDLNHVVRSNICIFMPYLHFETAEGRQKMQEAISRVETLRTHPGLSKASTRDEMLIRAHVNSSTASLHVRRTLDQFFYPNIDTQVRDQDQVVYRYQTRWNDQNRSWNEPKIFMVDQLWMWILGKNLIVTSFPQRWEQPKNDPLNVLDGIIEDINSKTREPVRSVYELATVISGRCSGVFDRHRLGDEEYQFLDMFESSIGTATDRETVLFREFNTASAQASEWLKHHRQPRRFALDTMPRGNDGSQTRNDQTNSEDEAFEQPLFVDKLLDIGQETDLLAEAKDIRDELNMIRTVLDHQRQVLLDLQEAICELYLGEHKSQSEIKKRFREQQRIVEMHVKDVDRMDKQTERIYHSITDLLDLKQKHANAFEARFARDQAAGTTRQGKTIMLFTIVTIIFLPLSFIASFFAINVAEFPHDSISTSLPLSYVAKYIFGIGFSISIPMILLALSVDDIRHGFREASRRIRGWRIRNRNSKNRRLSTSGGGGNTVDLAAQALEIERILSAAKARRSVESDYFGGGLLPVATRGTGRSAIPSHRNYGQMGNGTADK